MCFRRLAWRTDCSTGLICDHTIALNAFYSKQGYPNALRRVRFKDPEIGKRFVFSTNHSDLAQLAICRPYKMSWQVELFFKWIKQNLRMKTFFGTLEGAVRIQTSVGTSTDLLVAIVRKQLRLKASKHEILQILSLSLFEKPCAFRFLRLLWWHPTPPHARRRHFLITIISIHNAACQSAREKHIPLWHHMESLAPSPIEWP